MSSAFAMLLLVAAPLLAWVHAHMPLLQQQSTRLRTPAQISAGADLREHVAVLGHTPVDTVQPFELDATSQLSRWTRLALPAAACVGATVLLSPSTAYASGIADSAFVQASSLIFVSEIGDKTFFIAALLAARASKLLTFAGCAGALALMTVISVIIGQVFHAVPPSITRGLPIDDYVAIASFVYFGVKALLDAKDLDDGSSGIDDEREAAEKTLEEAGTEKKSGWPLVVEACTLTIVAEIGDRSQIATIALAAAANPFGVAGGAIFGHCIATGMAVLGGSFISKYLSEKVIGIIGGVLFLIFAATTAYGLF
uniref:GDT1 family protein n=1 Tax=Coccolithus braarudii TaxID=221442 RepID=A0A6T7G1K6_9EUKA